MSSLPSTMTAVLLTRLGGPEVLEVRNDVPLPTIGPGQVLVRVGAAAVNNTDINTRIGWYSKSGAGASTAEAVAASVQTDPTKEESDKHDDGTWRGEGMHFPRIQGADVAGTVVAVGDGVDPSRFVGKRVLVDPCPVPIVTDEKNNSSGNNDQDVTYLGSERDGGFAQYCAIPARSAHIITNTTLTDEELATFPCSYSTAENALQRAGCMADDVVLVTGASGGVGSAAVQLAKRRGAKVVAVCGTTGPHGPAKVVQLQALGADQVLDRSANLLESLGPESVTLVYDVVGGGKDEETWPRLLDILKRRGCYCTSGAIAGPIVPLDLRTLYLKDLTLLGTTALDSGVFESLVQYINDGQLKPLVAGTYPLADIARAQQDFLEKKHVGKLVLVPPQP